MAAQAMNKAAISSSSTSNGSATEGIVVNRLEHTDINTIEKIARWYFSEWNTPIDKTLQILSNPVDPDSLAHFVLTERSEVVATVGVRKKVNLQKAHPKYQEYGPWVALLYTAAASRNRGLGKLLLDEIDRFALANSLPELFIYTFTAESLYTRNGWVPIERLDYKGHNTVVMKKKFTSNSNANEG